MPMHCWAISIERKPEKRYVTRYAPLKACNHGDGDVICTESLGCNKKELADPLFCLGPFNNIVIHGFKKPCGPDETTSWWSDLTQFANNDYILNSALTSSPGISSEESTRVVTTQKTTTRRRTKTATTTTTTTDDASTRRTIAMAMLMTRPKTTTSTIVNFRPSNGTQGVAKSGKAMYNLQCMRCSGKDFKDCHARGRLVTCAKNQVCLTSVRKRNGKLYHVLKDCKQTLACLNMKRHNFKHSGKPNQCRPWAHYGPSVCRQCCSQNNVDCRKKFWSDSQIMWKKNFILPWKP